MIYLRSIVALSMLTGIVGAFYDVPLSSAHLTSVDSAPQHTELVPLPAPIVVTVTEPVKTASKIEKEEPQELPSMQEEQETQQTEPQPKLSETLEDGAHVSVPFYSQFTDISDPAWKKIGCGIASLAMIIDYYKPAVSVDALLTQGIAADAYLRNAGWTYKGLIGVGQTYNLDGSSHDLAALTSTAAFDEFNAYVKEGPVIASVHYKFDPASTIPHLVVINEIVGNSVYYNDPAAPEGGGEISTADFLKAWKRRFIVIRPTTEGLSLLSNSPAQSFSL